LVEGKIVPAVVLPHEANWMQPFGIRGKRTAGVVFALPENAFADLRSSKEKLCLRRWRTRESIKWHWKWSHGLRL